MNSLEKEKIEGEKKMKLEIEKFISDVEFPEAAMSFIEEGILCYKVGAYRSAYIMSYLFFLNVVKHRALESSYAPNGIEDNEWKAKKELISNEESWETNVFTLITTLNKEKKFSRFFKINKSRIAQMEYWRMLRNDCVHSKDNQIAAANVESFWLFVQSILPKLVINGSKDFLMRELDEYFDNVYFYNPNKVHEIVKSIPHLAENNNISELFMEIHSTFREKSNYRISSPDGKGYEFWKAVNESDNPSLYKSFNKFLTHSDEIFARFIVLFPERFLQCHAENRSRISSYVNNELPHWVSWNIPNAVSLLCTSIRNELLNPEKVKELVSQINCDLKKLSREEIILLKSHDYFENVKTEMMSGLYRKESLSYEKINGKSVQLACFVKYCLTTDQDGERFTVLLNNTLKSLINPSVFNELKEVLTQEPQILQYIKDVLAKQNEELCNFFNNL